MSHDTQQLLEQLYDLFAARTDTYAVGRPKPTDPTKYAYFRQDAPYTVAVLERHVRGQEQVAVYPIFNDHVRWAAIDFDAPKSLKGSVDGFEAAWADAQVQQQEFAKEGLITYLERSRSGNGVHLWMFFRTWQSAALVRRALLPLLQPGITYDRIYPLQDHLEPGEYGNVLALPFAGKAVAQGCSTFLDAERQPIPVRDWLATLQYTDTELLTALAARAPLPRSKPEPVAVEGQPSVQFGDATLDGRPAVPLTGWLKVQSPYGCGIMHHAWKHRRELPEPLWYAVLQQASCFENGRELAHLLSRDYPHYSPSETDEKYNHALENPPMGCDALRAQFPHIACPGCPRLAPYHLAKKPLVECVGNGHGEAIRGGFGAFKSVIRAYDEGTVDPGLSFGHVGMDRVVRRRNGEMTVFGAMPSVGKSSWMVDSAVRTASQRIPTFVFSAETGEIGLRNRIIANVAGINSKALRGERIDDFTDQRQPLTAEEWEAVERAVAHLDELPLFLDFSATKPDHVLTSIERVLIKHGIGFDAPWVAEFDYLQFAGVEPNETIEQATSRASKEFKSIAKLTNRPWNIYAQLVRHAEGAGARSRVRGSDTPREPQLTDFRGSGRIEQDADIAYILGGERLPGVLAHRILWLLKQREGEVGVRFEFELEKHTNRWRHLPSRQSTQVTPFLLGDA